MCLALEKHVELLCSAFEIALGHSNMPVQFSRLYIRRVDPLGILQIRACPVDVLSAMEPVYSSCPEHVVT